MAVIVKYIVVRNGEEKMTFATKKEADAYDKMLDIADNLFEFLEASDLKYDEDKLEELSLLLSENRDAIIPILRGTKPKAKPSEKKSEKKEAGSKKTTKKAQGKK